MKTKIKWLIIVLLIWVIYAIYVLSDVASTALRKHSKIMYVAVDGDCIPAKQTCKQVSTTNGRVLLCDCEVPNEQ